MTFFLGILILALSWQPPVGEIAGPIADVKPPEGCSHAKTAIARAATAAKALRPKSTDDPLAEETDVLHYATR
jgi:hypothetical protein